MTAQSLPIRLLAGPIASRLRQALQQIAALLLCVGVAACGDSTNAPPPPAGGPVLPVPPAITQQPANLTVMAGQPASFTVTATGTAPLTYQWQRNNVDLVGATSATYTLPATVLGDSGATFRAVVTNAAGNATSINATLTVTAAAPVLTISPQPANTSVTASATASFTVGGICSSGTLGVQWQRNSGAQGAFVAIAGANATTYSFMTVLADSGAQFRAVLDCSGQSSTPSNAATLTVTAPGSVTVSLYPIAGLRDQARMGGLSVIDRLPDGSWAMFQTSRLVRLSADLSAITPIAGANTGGQAYADGAAASARFTVPLGITHDAAGVIYVADTQNSVIRRVAADGTVSTLAGSAGQPGTADGTGSAARFGDPSGIVLGPDGDLYVADARNHSIRRVTAAGVVTTYAGSGTAGFADGPAATAQFNQPFGIVATANGDVIVTDRVNARVRRVVRSGTTAGAVETLAGSGATTVPGADGSGAIAGIPYPQALVVQGNAVFVRDNGGLIRQIDLATRAVTTFTGSRTLADGYADGPPGAAQLRSPLGLAAGPAGGLIAADDIGVRVIDAAGNVTTIASRNGYETDAGTGVLAQLPFQAQAIAVDGLGRVANYDKGSRAVRYVDASGNVTLMAGLTGSYAGVVDGKGSAAQFSNPLSMTAAPNNVLYVGDNTVLRRIGTDGTVSTLAGSIGMFGAADGTGSNALFNQVFGLAIGPGGDVFVADPGNSAIRRVNAAGTVTTYAGVLGQSGSVNGPIAQARLRLPAALTFTPDGTLWFADGIGGSQGLRKVSADGSTVASASANIGIVALASDTSGLVYYVTNPTSATPGGLYAFNPAFGTSTLLVPTAVDQQTRLGNVNPTLPFVDSIAVLGPKHILVSGGTQLLLVTLP